MLDQRNCLMSGRALLLSRRIEYTSHIDRSGPALSTPAPPVTASAYDDNDHANKHFFCRGRFC